MIRELREKCEKLIEDRLKAANEGVAAREMTWTYTRGCYATLELDFAVRAMNKLMSNGYASMMPSYNFVAPGKGDGYHQADQAKPNGTPY